MLTRLRILALAAVMALAPILSAEAGYSSFRSSSFSSSRSFSSSSYSKPSFSSSPKPSFSSAPKPSVAPAPAQATTVNRTTTNVTNVTNAGGGYGGGAGDFMMGAMVGSMMSHPHTTVVAGTPVVAAPVAGGVVAAPTVDANGAPVAQAPVVVQERYSPPVWAVALAALFFILVGAGLCYVLFRKEGRYY